ncbi:t-SNARE VTI1 [Umbelopsis nana]
MLPLQLKELEIQLKGSAPSEYLEEKTRNKEYGKDSETYSRRDQMLKQTNRIEGSSERLKRTQIIALENERIGGDILNTLRGQRETIERTKDTIAEAEDNVDRSNKTLKSMASWW